MNRRYTVQEISEMRGYVRQMIEDQSAMRSYPSTLASAAEVEEQLRTYLLHGTTPAELGSEAARVRAAMIDDIE